MSAPASLPSSMTRLLRPTPGAPGAGGRPARRRIAVTAMVSGALLGAVLVTNVDLVLPLAITAALLAASAVAAARLDRG